MKSNLPTPDERQASRNAAKSQIGRYHNLRLTYLPFLFSLPLYGLVYKLLPLSVPHHNSLSIALAFIIGVPLGELARYWWVRLFTRSGR